MKTIVDKVTILSPVAIKMALHKRPVMSLRWVISRIFEDQERILEWKWEKERIGKQAVPIFTFRSWLNFSGRIWVTFWGVEWGKFRLEMDAISFSDAFHFHSSFLLYNKRRTGLLKIRNLASLFGQEHLVMLRLDFGLWATDYSPLDWVRIKNLWNQSILSGYFGFIEYLDIFNMCGLERNHVWEDTLNLDSSINYKLTEQARFTLT